MRRPSGKLLCRLATAATLAAALSLGAAPPRAGAQGPPSSSQQPVEKAQAPIRVGVSLVNLYATVRDKDKRVVPDLKQEEFRVFEDDKEQKVEFFSKETNLPLTFGMLIDTSPSQERVLGAEQDAGARFLRRVLNKGDMAFVLNFDSNIDLLSDFTSSHDQLARAIDRARVHGGIGGGGIIQGPVATQPRGTRMYDAIYAACKEKLSGEVGRKALILLTDAVDQGSQVREQEALETAQRTDTVLHFIVISDAYFYRGMGLGGGGEGVAKKMAEQTGGRAISVNNEKDLEKAFDQISEELRTYYTIGYTPSNRARDGKFRKLKVEATRKDTKILARKGYYAPS